MAQFCLGNLPSAKSSDASSDVCMYSRKGQVVKVGTDIRNLFSEGGYIAVA